MECCIKLKSLGFMTNSKPYTFYLSEYFTNRRRRLNSNDLSVLTSLYENWPPDFDGSVHLKYLEQSIDLNWPQNASVTYSENRIKVKFERELKQNLSHRYSFGNWFL